MSSQNKHERLLYWKYSFIKETKWLKDFEMYRKLQFYIMQLWEIYGFLIR